MDVVKAIQNYVHRMLTDASGMKVLLMDSETVGHLLMVVVVVEMFLAYEMVSLVDILTMPHSRSLRYYHALLR